MDRFNLLGILDQLLLGVNAVIVLDNISVIVLNLFWANDSNTSFVVLKSLLLALFIQKLFSVKVSSVLLPHGLQLVLVLHVGKVDIIISHLSKSLLLLLELVLFKILLVQVLFILFSHFLFEIIHFLLSSELLLLHVP